MADDEQRHVPNIHVLRSAFQRGVGAARARGTTGCTALLDAAVAEVVAWGTERPRYPLDVDGARAALLAMGGGPGGTLWNEAVPESESLPEGLEALVEYAVENYGLPCMWFANRPHLAATPRTSWGAITEMLRNYGGPDPRPFWLADAIERAAAEEGAIDVA